MVDWVWDICEGIWNRKGWIEEYSEGIIVPIVRKGEERRIEEYRGVTLTPTLYKVYMTVLASRLREEVERNELISQN